MDQRIERLRQLIEVVDRLRGPGGCPWDREQTHLSLRSTLLEEAYEVLETIDELRAWSLKMFEQVVQDRNMPIGSEMSDDERAMLARWIERQGSWKPR